MESEKHIIGKTDRTCEQGRDAYNSARLATNHIYTWIQREGKLLCHLFLDDTNAFLVGDIHNQSSHTQELMPTRNYSVAKLRCMYFS